MYHVDELFREAIFMENFRNLTSQQPLWRALGNSFFYAILTTVICLLICSIAGYGFEVYHDKWKDRVFSILLLAMMVPQVATMVPLFKMFSKAGLLNTAVGFILPIISTPFMIMMFRQNARSFPVDIIEAARIDGLSEVRIFFQMFIPTMKSTYAAAAVITFMNAWNSYLWPKGNHDRQQGNDHANADRQPDYRLCDRLWYADVRRIILFYPDNGCIFRTAETVC